METNGTKAASVIVTKTPVGFLQDLCTKKRVIPTYDLIAADGQLHEPTYVYRLTVEDLKAIGYAKSKRLAKHMAAQIVLEQIVNLGRYKEWGFPGESQEAATEYLHQAIPEYYENAQNANMTFSDATLRPGVGAVTQLQELCFTNKWPSPVYEEIAVEGPPHERMFRFNVTLDKYQACGAGRSKKLAKHNAAVLLIRQLKELSDEQRSAVQDATQSMHFYPISRELKASSFAAIQQPFLETDETSLMVDQLSETFTCLKGAKKSMEQVFDIDFSKETPEEKHLQLLISVCKEEDWMYQFCIFPNLDKNRNCQCVVQLSTNPIAVCHGTGPDKHKAEIEAAFNALEYLQIIFSQ